MNTAIGAYVGVSKQTEMLLMTVLALWVNIFDMAIFEISSNLDQVWNVEIDKEVFNPNAEYVIRMLLSGVVLIRTFTLHMYIAFLIAVFWPVCFGTRPTLMLPWLVVSAIKNLGTGLVSIGTGGYTCMIYGPLRPACLRFLLSQVIDLSPSFYMWFVGLSLYSDLKKSKSVNKLQVKAMEDQELNMALRRRKVKSMIDEDILRQQFESRTFQKKFLGTSAVEVNEFINRCSYENLKNKFSRSLDSLLDVLTVQTELLDIEDSEPLDIDSSSTLQQKTAKLLGISMDEIDYIKQNRQTRTDFPAYPIQPQKKIQTISLINSRYESPAKLLPETSLYSPPNVKPIRVTKSELKSAKDFTKNESEFIQATPEKEMQVHDLTQDESFESLTKVQMQMVYQSTNSSFKAEDVADDITNVENKKISTKKKSVAKEHVGECSNKNRDKYVRKQDRGKLVEDVQLEIPQKYKFCNTMSDKSHYLLDEHCFLFDKESIIKKKESSKVDSVYAKRKRSIDHNQYQNPSEEKQRRLNAPIIDALSNTKTIFKDSVINKKMPLDGKLENKSNKPSFKKMKDDIVNKKILKQSEKTQAIKKKIVNTRKMPPNEYSSIPVLHRNTKCKTENHNFVKNKVTAKTRSDNLNKNYKNSVSHENKLYTIEENKDIALVSSNDQKNKDLSVNKVTEENKSSLINQEEKQDLFVFNQEEKRDLFVLNQEEKRDLFVLNQEEKQDLFVPNQEEENKNKNILFKNEKFNSAEDSKISVSAEITRINQKNSKISSKNNLFKIMGNNNKSASNKKETTNKSNLTEARIPVPFLSIKHSNVKMASSQNQATHQPEKILPKEENKPLFNSSQALSEKILHILKDKNKSKPEKISGEDIFKEKNKKTELFKTGNNNNNEFEFTAKINEKGMNLPVKSVSRNKQLEFHFKEKFTKTKDNKMEDLFKKKTVSERKDSKTSDKDKQGFPSYFSNKINRMITDACQIRKKSCKKINLFIKVPTNTNSKQRNKLSTIELFRKQSPPKTNSFDITRKLSFGKLEIPPCKGEKCKDRTTNLTKTKPISHRIEINLFNTENVKDKKEINLFGTEEAKSMKETFLFNTEEVKSKKSLSESSIPPLTPLSKTSVHSNDKLPDKTINKTDEIQSNSTEQNNLFQETRDNTSLISSFMLFRSNDNNNVENLNSSHITNEAVNNVEETKSKCFILTNADTKDAQVEISSVKIDMINDDTKCVKQSESPYEITVSNQKSNTSIATQETSFFTISETRTCKTLSEQAMNKIISLTKTDYSTKANESNTNTTASNKCLSDVVEKSSCKRLSEQAINKIISITNTGYSNYSSCKSNESQLNTSIVQESSNCKKLSDFAINKLLAITTPKYACITDKKPSFIAFSKTKIENKQEINEEKNVLFNKKHTDISINVTKSENFDNTTSNRTNKYIYDSSSMVDLDDFNKALKATHSEKNNNLHVIESKSPKDSKTKINRKSSIPVMKEDIITCKNSTKIISSTTKIENNNKIIGKKCNDSATANKRHIISLIEDAINMNNHLIGSTKNTFLGNSNPNLNKNISEQVENQNVSIIDTEIKHCKEASQLDSSIHIESLNKTHSSSNEIMLTTKPRQVDKNYKWMSQESINIFASNASKTPIKEKTLIIDQDQNILNIKDEKIYEEIIQNDSKNTVSTKCESPKETLSSFKKDMSSKEENINNAIKEEIECSTSAINECILKIKSHSNEATITTEVIQNKPINRESNYKWTPQCSIQLIYPNNCEPVEENNSISIKEQKNEEINCKDKFNTISSKNTFDANIFITNEERNNKEISQNNNNEFQANIPVLKVEKECKGTSQHRIKLISLTDKNCPEKPIEEQINDKTTNVIKINHEHESLNNNSKLLSSLLYETVNDSNLPIKETKVCRGTSQHNIKLISSIKHECSSETNLCHNEKISCHTKDDLYIPLKEQKVIRGSAQNYVKLISPSKEECACNTNYLHKEALSNILKEYQSVPIMKEEKVCKGTSKHKIKLVSSYKRDSPTKINLFHTETEYKNNKNENITIIKEEKMYEGTLQHSIKLVSSSKNNSLNKTIFIVKEHLPKEKEAISVTKEECKDNEQKCSTANRPSLQTNVFVNVNTVNGKQNFTVIQKQNDDKKNATSSTTHEMNLFVNDKMTNTEESKTSNTEENNLDEGNNMATFRKIISNTIQDFFENDAEKLTEETGTDFLSTNKESNDNPLVDTKSSEILSSLINKVQHSLKLQASNKEDFIDEEPDDFNMPRCTKYLSNQVDFGCQTSTLSKKVLENNPNKVAKKLSSTKSITKSSSAKSYQDLNLQKLAFTMTSNKNINSKLETKSNNENLLKDEKKDSTIVLHSRSSRNASYVSIHKERLEKAKSLESDLNKSVILHNCAFLEDGYTRLYNLLGVKQDSFDIKTRKKVDSSFNF